MTIAEDVRALIARKGYDAELEGDGSGRWILKTGTRAAVDAAKKNA